MKYWVNHKGNLASIEAPDYGDIAIALNKNRVYRYAEDDQWYRDLYSEEDLLPDLIQTDRQYAELAAELGDR